MTRVKKIFNVMAIFGIILIIFPICLLYHEDSILNNNKEVIFYDSSGVKLIGTYYKGTRELGILFSHGYAGDQSTWKSMAIEYLKLGFHVFTFDFEGHGRSSEAMELYYTHSDHLAKQVIAGKEMFKKLSGLEDSDIILFGYSMGGRAILQSTQIDESVVKMIILLGCYVNLESNARSTRYRLSNDQELNWVRALSEDNPPTDILLITGELDDVSTPYRNQLLLQKLGGNISFPHKRKLIIVEGLIHSHEIYSEKVMTYSLDWILENLNLESNTLSPGINSMVLRKILWCLSIFGFFCLIFGGLFSCKYNQTKTKFFEAKLYFNQEFNGEIRIVSMKKFITWKILFWLISIPFIFCVQLLLLLLPLSIHYFPLWGTSALGTNAILMFFIYLKEKMPGTRGKFKLNLKIKNHRDAMWDILKAFSLIFFLSSTLTLIANTGIFYIFPCNDRLIWLIIFTLLLIPSFLLLHLEFNCLQHLHIKTLKNKKTFKLMVILLDLVPFLLYISWMSSLYGLLIFSLVFFAAFLIHGIGKNPILTIIFQAFLLNYLLLPQGVLYPSIF